MSTSINFPEKFIPIFSQVITEGDRGSVIVGTSYIEEIIKDKFLSSSEFDHFSFGQKVALIKRIYVNEDFGSMLSIVKDVRNNAAHKTEIFRLSNYGQTISNNLFKKIEKFDLYKQVMDMKFNSPQFKNITNFGDAIKKLGKETNSENKYKFIVSCLVIGLILESITVSDFFKIKEAKFNPK